MSALSAILHDPRTTNAPELWDGEDFIGHALPKHEPVAIEFDTVVRHAGTADEAKDTVFIVIWSDGTWWKAGSVPREWSHVRLDTARAASALALSKLDAAIAGIPLLAEVA